MYYSVSIFGEEEELFLEKEELLGAVALLEAVAPGEYTIYRGEEDITTKTGVVADYVLDDFPERIDELLDDIWEDFVIYIQNPLPTGDIVAPVYVYIFGDEASQMLFWSGMSKVSNFFGRGVEDFASIFQKT